MFLLESMACGTPMVSFDVGGVPDLVRPGLTGYLARPEDAQDLRQWYSPAPRRYAAPASDESTVPGDCRCTEYSVRS